MRLRKKSEPRVSVGTLMMGESPSPTFVVGKKIPTTFPTLKREAFATKTSKVVTASSEKAVAELGETYGTVGYHQDVAAALTTERSYHPRLGIIYQPAPKSYPVRIVVHKDDGTREEYTLGTGHSHTHEIV